MKMLPYYATLALALCAATGLAQAQKLAPGLWETTMTMKAQGGEMEAGMAKMQAEMAKMPPEQRKMVEEMMAKRGVGMAAGKPNAVRTCISKERAENMDIPEQQDNERNCKRESMERSGSTMKFKYSCTNPPSTGQGEYTFNGDKSYSGKMLIDTQVKGQPQQMEMQQQGKWISADCGNILPR